MVWTNVSMLAYIYPSHISNTLLHKCLEKYANNHKQKKSCNSKLQYKCNSDLLSFLTENY